MLQNRKHILEHECHLGFSFNDFCLGLLHPGLSLLCSGLGCPGISVPTSWPQLPPPSWSQPAPTDFGLVVPGFGFIGPGFGLVGPGFGLIGLGFCPVSPGFKPGLGLASPGLTGPGLGLLYPGFLGPSFCFLSSDQCRYSNRPLSL